MRRRRRKAQIRVGSEEEDVNAKRETRNPKPETSRMSQYVFTFEFVRQYPTVRSFIVKAPLKRSFKDSITELIGGSKKGTYRF